MRNLKEKRELPKSFESYTRGLLSTTCLTVACASSAVAGTITEGTGPAPAEFPNSPNGFALPSLTTVVNGLIGNGAGVEGGFDSQDWFIFTGLTPSASYTFTALPVGENGISVTLLSDSGTPGGQIGPTLDLESGGGGNSFSFNAPLDGNVVVDVFSHCECNGGNYTVSLDSSSDVPEPATLAGVGLGLTTLGLAWRRRRRA